jgi:hypothetical protein
MNQARNAAKPLSSRASMSRSIDSILLIAVVPMRYGRHCIADAAARLTRSVEQKRRKTKRHSREILDWKRKKSLIDHRPAANQGNLKLTPRLETDSREHEDAAITCLESRVA